MEATLIEVATTQGIWVLLFVSLFIYTIKRYEAMEEKQETTVDGAEESSE